MGKAPLGHSLAMLIGATDAVRPLGNPKVDAVGLDQGRDARAGTAAGAPPVLTPHRLYDTHFSFVWRSLRHLGIPEGVVEDAAQDVFLVVHRRWESFDATWSAVETWLFGIVMRVARTYRRSARRGAWAAPSGSDLAEVIPSTDEGPAEVASRREAALLLDRLLAGLDDDKRAIVVLVDVEQMSVPQAAEALGINLNAAYWRLRAARGQLKRALLRIKAAESRFEDDMKKTT